MAAAQTQLEHGRYPASTLYGDGHVADRIAKQLASLRPYVQKKLDYCRSDFRTFCVNRRPMSAIYYLLRMHDVRISHALPVIRLENLMTFLFVAANRLIWTVSSQ